MATTIFTENDKFIFDLPRLNSFFDYCPVEGIQDFNTDPDCLFQCLITDEGDAFRILKIANNKDTEPHSRKGKNLTIVEIKKSMIWKLLNDFNNSGSLYIIDGFELNEESLLYLNGNLLLEM